MGQEVNLSDIIKHVGVTDEQLDQECSDALLLEIAQKIVTYQRYAHKLGLSDPEIISFQHNMTVANDVRLITAEVFKSWHRKQAYLATYRALAMVAAQLGDKSGAQIICEICAKEVPKETKEEIKGISTSTEPAEEIDGPVSQQVATQTVETMKPFCTEELYLPPVFDPSKETIPGCHPGLIHPGQRWDTDLIKALKVHFLNPEVLSAEKWKCGNDPLTITTILSWATYWNRPNQKYPEIANEKAKKEVAHIRVEFSSEKISQSYVGNTSQIVVDLNKPTMILNLRGMSAKLQRSTVLHEFGHALGLYHEHQRSDFWDVLEDKDEEDQYRFIIGIKKMKEGKLRNGKECKKALKQHFRLDFEKQTKIEWSPYDSASIMHYWFDKNWLLEEYQDLSKVPENLTALEKSVLRGVHARDYTNGDLAENPSQSDYDSLNKAYGLPSRRESRFGSPHGTGGKIESDCGEMPGFICPRPRCKKCSLEEFLSNNGCANPEPSADTEAAESLSFPFLNVSRLSPIDKVVLENKLIKEYRKIDKSFRVFVSNLALTFSGDIEKIRIFLLLDEYLKELRPELRRATTFSEILEALCNHLSFYKYEILKGIIEEYGTDDHKRLLRDYLNEFEIYCQRSVFEVPFSAFRYGKDCYSDPTRTVFALKYTKERPLTLQQAKSTTQDIAKILNIDPSWRLTLISIQKGCCLLIFSVPRVFFEKQQLFLKSQEFEKLSLSFIQEKLTEGVPVPAVQFQTSQHSSMATPEYRTMVGCTSALVNTLAQNIEGIGRAFNDEGLIAPAVFETTQSHIREPKEKAHTLVSTLTSKMKITRSATGSFFKFVSLLMHQGPWIRELIDTLRDVYEENEGHTFPTWPDTSSEHNVTYIGNIGLSSEPDFPVTTKTGSQAHGSESPTKGDLPHLQGEVLNQYCGEMLHVEKKIHKESENVQGIRYAFGSVRTSQLWDTGSFQEPLKVHFMNPEVLENENWMCGRNLLTTNTVLAWATYWNGHADHYPKLAGIHATRQEAQIRVYFTSSEHSRSFVGNDALLVKNKSKPTMYLNLFGKSEADQRSLVLHEFGHALGLDHEHQRSDFWKILEKFTVGKRKMEDGDDGQCAKAVAEHFKKEFQGRVGLQQTDYDPQSIMHYWFDVKWLMPKYQDREYVECETDGILTDKERAVILGVHDHNYRNGELAKDPSVNDFKVLNDAYKYSYVNKIHNETDYSKTGCSNAYNTMVRCSVSLNHAMSKDPTTLAVALYSARFISLATLNEIFELNDTKSAKGSQLYSAVLGKVRSFPKTFVDFIDILRRDRLQYGDVLMEIERTFFSDSTTSSDGISAKNDKQPRDNNGKEERIKTTEVESTVVDDNSGGASEIEADSSESSSENRRKRKLSDDPDTENKLGKFTPADEGKGELLSENRRKRNRDNPDTENKLGKFTLADEGKGDTTKSRLGTTCAFSEHQLDLEDSTLEVITLEELIRHTGVTHEQLEQECDDVLLNDIAEHIVSYLKYGPKLGLSAADITTFQQNMTIAHNAKLITAEVFKEWHKKRSFLATYRALAEVALELGDGTGATNICEICAKGLATPSIGMEKMDTVTLASAEHSQRGSTQEVLHAPTTQHSQGKSTDRSQEVPNASTTQEPQLPQGKLRGKGRSRGTMNSPKPADRRPGHKS